MRQLKYLSQFEYLPSGEFEFQGKIYLKIAEFAHPIRLLTEEELEEIQSERREDA